MDPSAGLLTIGAVVMVVLTVRDRRNAGRRGDGSIHHRSGDGGDTDDCAGDGAGGD